MKSFRLRGGAALLLALAAAPAWAGPITGVVSFWDSLSDEGNSFTQFGYPASPPYSSGRFSNGPLWLDRLASRLGLAAPTASLNGGADYAFGGASTQTYLGAPAGFSPIINPALQAVGLAPNIDTQVASYLAGHTPTAGTLYTLWAGANDFFDGQTNPTAVADNLKADLQTLMNKGAKDFLVVNLPPLDKTPLAGVEGPAAQAGLQALTLGFNAELNADLNALQQANPGVTIHRLDAFGLLEQVEADPAAYGLTDAADMAYNVFAGTPPNANANQFLFWDDVHPTSAAGRIIGDAAFNAVAPEPTAALLLLTGGAMCFARLRRKR